MRVVRDADDGTVLAERSEFIGTATNNVAEYRGLIAGLRAAAELGAAEVAVRMDSKLVVEQMKGAWQVKNAALRVLAREAVELRGRFATVTFQWIPREQNRDADRLANQAMDRGAGGPAAAPTAAASTGERWIPNWAPPTEPGTRLILVRHGDTAYSGEQRFCGSTDVPLTQLGEQQAAALAARSSTFGAVAAIVSSPLQRARRTAELIADALDLPVGVDGQLAELDFGAWEGLTVDEAQAQDPDAFARWISSPDAAPPGGEPFAAARRYRRAPRRSHRGAAWPHERGRLACHADQDDRAARAGRPARRAVPDAPRPRVGVDRRLSGRRQRIATPVQRHQSPRLICGAIRR